MGVRGEKIRPYIHSLVGVKNNVRLWPLHSDPRWQPFLVKMNLDGWGKTLH